MDRAILSITKNLTENHLIHLSFAVTVEAGESPTVVLDRADATAPSQRQPTDPFRDVIKTEPAPDLPSLIEDMIPYLAEHSITTARPTTSMATSVSKTSAQDLAANQLQHPVNFDFVEQDMLHIRPPFDYAGETVDSSFVSGMKYGMKGDVLPEDSVSLTYESKDQIADPGEAESPDSSASIFRYDATPLTELNRTMDEKNSHRSNITQQSAMGNLSKSDDSEFAGNDRATSNHTGSNNWADGKIVEDVEDDGIFSLDSILELLLSSNSSESTRMPDAFPISDARDDQQTLAVSSTDAEKLIEERNNTVETSSKVLDNEIPIGTLLKLAGCNIYGRMYRVGRIITELSSLCQECRCTEIGVQCKQLEC